MKNFSNESKKRCKAIVKTIFKRYVWLPALLYVFYILGFVCINLLKVFGDDFVTTHDEEMKGFVGILYNVEIGFITFVCIAVITFCIALLLESFINYMKKRTLIHDIKEFFKELGEMIILCASFMVKLPKKIYERIKSEPERFKSALNKEMQKQE